LQANRQSPAKSNRSKTAPSESETMGRMLSGLSRDSFWLH
jgi:hypothetical protein